MTVVLPPAWRLVLLLAVLTALTFTGVEPLARALWPDRVQWAAEELHYVSHAALGLLLYLALLWAADAAVTGRLARSALLAVCLFGAFCDALAMFCGAAWLWANGPGPADLDKTGGLCAATTYWRPALLAGCCFALLLMRNLRKDRHRAAR